MNWWAELPGIVRFSVEAYCWLSITLGPVLVLFSIAANA